MASKQRAKKEPDISILSGSFFLIIKPCLHPSAQALSTKPDLRQDVHTYIFCEPPVVLTLTDFTFALQILFDLLCE